MTLLFFGWQPYKMNLPTENVPQDEDSVIAYPKHTGQHNTVLINSWVSGAKGADPIAINLTLPPITCRIFSKKTLLMIGVSYPFCSHSFLYLQKKSNIILAMRPLSSILAWIPLQILSITSCVKQHKPLAWGSYHYLIRVQLTGTPAIIVGWSTEASPFVPGLIANDWSVKVSGELYPIGIPWTKHIASDMSSRTWARGRYAI